MGLTESSKHFSKFTQAWTSRVTQIASDPSSLPLGLRESYQRLTTLQAWRHFVLDATTSADALAFFIEAQNDALVSHVLAGLGSWRSALKHLRSTIENVLAFIYYREHAVELELWASGEHRLGMTALISYFNAHPRVCSIPRSLTGLEILEKEYTTLSRAVHASATSFRMTSSADVPKIWDTDPIAFKKWLSRERATLRGINLLLLCLFRERLAGAALRDLRSVLGPIVGANVFPEIHNVLGVRLIQPSS